MATLVPKLYHDDPAVVRWSDYVRQAINEIQGSRTPAITPTNLRIIPVAAGNKIQFTRSDGDSYLLYWSTTPRFSQATAVNIGLSNDYFDNIGKGAIKRYYWVQALKVAGLPSQPTAIASGTSLAQATDTVVPSPPPPNDSPAINSATGNPDPIGARIGGLNEVL